MKIYINLSGENDISIELKHFFFDEGKITYKFFLIPENANENGYEKFDILIKVINNVT